MDAGRADQHRPGDVKDKGPAVVVAATGNNVVRGNRT
jgi:hypothetical protein